MLSKRYESTDVDRRKNTNHPMLSINHPSETANNAGHLLNNGEGLKYLNILKGCVIDKCPQNDIFMHDSTCHNF